MRKRAESSARWKRKRTPDDEGEAEGCLHSRNQITLRENFIKLLLFPTESKTIIIDTVVKC